MVQTMNKVCCLPLNLGIMSCKILVVMDDNIDFCRHFYVIRVALK